MKVLVNPSIMYDDHVQLLYTHLVTDDDQRLLAAVRYGPTFLQAYVDKELDVRVTVIGNKVFAVGIRANASDGSRVDFRRAPLY